MKLTFFFPYHQVSGVPVLFSGLINEIISSKKIEKIYIIDYHDGALNGLTKNSDKLVRLFFEDKKKIYVPTDSILIMQSIVPYTIREELIVNLETKVFFWNLHPENLIPNLIPIHRLNNFLKSNYSFYKKIIDILFKKRFKLMRNFVEMCLSKKGIVFMDETNIFNTCYKLGIEKPKEFEFLPVPVKLANKKVFDKDTSKVSVSWVGRVEGFKFSIINFILEKFSRYSLDNKLTINFHLIGDGIKLNEILNKKYENEYFKLIAYGNLKYESLVNLLFEKIHLAFAMGTSALDSAKLGIPTVLVDYSYKKIKNYKFRWIFDTQNYDLTHEIDNNNYKGPSYSFIEIIKQNFKLHKELSLKSKNYVIRNHSIKVIAKKFIRLVSNSKLAFGEIDDKILKKSILRKFYYKLNNYYTGIR